MGALARRPPASFLRDITLLMTLAARLRTHRNDGFALDVDFRVDAGVTIVFGASGSGKTTLLRSIAGLIHLDSGTVSIGNDIVFDDRTNVDVPPSRRRIGFVFQELALFPHLTAGENIAYGLSSLARNARRDAIHTIATSFRIEHLLERRPPEISGGERQRVGLARTLVTNPRALLLDEPLTGLDRPSQSRILDDLRVWNDGQRIPIVYVTHSQREVFAIGERVLVLERGRIVADGSPELVMREPETEAMAALVGFENVFDLIVLSRIEDAGVMHARAAKGVEFEVPLAAVMEGASIRVAIRAGDILIATEPPHGLSARNILPGTIVDVAPEGSHIRVRVDVGLMLDVHVTPTARTTLDLRAGRQVWLVIKTHSCRVVRESAT